MKKITVLFFLCCMGFVSGAQKKNKEKKKTEPTVVDYTPPAPVADTSKKFAGIIRYRITSDDPADRDSMFIVFGQNQIRVIMFIPGYREDQVFERSMIANFKDSSFLELDTRAKTFKTEKLSARNDGSSFMLAGNKKTGLILNQSCQEYTGEMKTTDGEVFQSACLISNRHSYVDAMDYYFLNIQPVVIGYKIVLGFRTKSSDNENTYFVAYKIEPGATDSFFDLSQYQSK